MASKPIEPVIRDSIETLDCNFGNNVIPPMIAPLPKDHNSSPNPVESSLNPCFAKKWQER